jgi:uncharacterized protein YjbJ (UPF0337 family)
MEHTTRMQERMQQRAQEAGQASSRGMESMASWLDFQQRMWRDFMHVSADTTRDSMRLWWEFSSNALEVLTAPAAAWVHVQKEAATWYDQAMRQGLESMQRAVDTMAQDGERGRRLLRQRWSNLRGRLRQQWAKLTDEELDQIQGDPDALIGKLQEHYGRSRSQAEQDLDRWLQEQQGKAA